MRHAIFAAVYTALALTVALTLPLSVAGMDAHTGILFGLVIFVFGALLHEFWARQEERELLDRRLWRLKEQQQEIRGLLMRVEERLAGGVTPRGEVEAVLSEARMLEALAGQIPPLRPATRQAGAAAAPMPAEPEPAAAAAAAESRQGTLFARPAPGPLTALMPERTTDDALVLDQIRGALRADRIDIFLQPVVSLPQRKHRYYEVFSRIRDDQDRVLLPEQYLAVAEREGLIAAIDNMLLFRCIQLIRETEKRHQNVGFFCNISAATLNDATFMREFVQYMGQHPTLTTKLVFELGQADLMQGGVFVTGFLDGLRRLGFRFSMDQVERLDIDWDEMARHEIRHVKLDAVRLLDPDGRFADPMAVRDLKHKLDRNAIDLIVEKVEQEAQVIELLDLYIDFGQGYLFGEPRLAKKPAG